MTEERDEFIAKRMTLRDNTSRDMISSDAMGLQNTMSALSSNRRSLNRRMVLKALLKEHSNAKSKSGATKSQASSGGGSADAPRTNAEGFPISERIPDGVKQLAAIKDGAALPRQIGPILGEREIKAVFQLKEIKEYEDRKLKQDRARSAGTAE